MDLKAPVTQSLLGSAYACTPNGKMSALVYLSWLEVNPSPNPNPNSNPNPDPNPTLALTLTLTLPWP